MASVSEPHDGNLSYTVLKALDVLECLASANESLTAQEVATRCDMSRPTVYRLLTTLQSRGYVMVSDTYEYGLGTKVLSLSKVLLDTLDLRDITQPYLQKLTEISGETTYLALLDGTEILYIARVESPQPLRTGSKIGARNPLHAAALGKAILAFLPPEQRRRLMEQIRLVPYTTQTIADQTALLDDLARVRERGYALDDLEMEENVRCIGAPIFNHMGQCFAAISISGPAYRMSHQRIDELINPLMEAAQAVSQQLGYEYENFKLPT